MKIVTVPNNVLSSPTKSVIDIDNHIKKIVSDMEQVLIAQDDPPGVGLAANQVGLDLSIFIIKPTEKSKTKVFINPQVVKTSAVEERSGKTAEVKSKKSKKKVKLEGCLSIPRIWGPVKRADRVFLNYQDLTGKKYLKWFSGFEAIIIQHEVDHLNGVVFTQRSIEQKRQLYREEKDELVKIEY
ncbi:MAG: peptide deformylase [Candidatus Roizmanbacteria bacterium]|nr:peptide deformylase [Candidatus Roizmanbacteria bacterium]MCR4312752.1 peptide deformylase [Candidatus Roizmanbacteria bacterium]